MNAAITRLMHGRRTAALGLALLGAAPFITSSAHVRAASPAADAALAQFLGAASPADAAKAADAVVKSGATFDEAYAALTRGRVYRRDAPTGIVKASHKAGDLTFNYQLEVPQTYDSTKPWQLRVQLHGGVGRPDPTPRGNGIGALAGAEQIYLLPTAWSEAEWWTDLQLGNLRSLLDLVKRTYNIDENRVVLSGVSDGGTAAYYFSMRDTTPFAAFLPLNGAIPVLRNTLMRIDGELFMNNMVNKPFFIVNGGKDPLYPTSLVEPYINQMQKGGVELTYLPQPEAVHNTAWWPQVKDTYEAFVKDHPRVPYPDRLTWESDLREHTGRAHWLVIDALAPTQKEGMPLPDVNERVGAAEPTFGVRVNGARVTSVTSGSNADTLGLVAGDVIARVNGRVLPSAMDATDLLDLLDSGAPLTLSVTRGGQPMELKGVYKPTLLPRRTPFFTHARPSGRVDLARSGNTITASTRRVAAFTLLLSPDQFDLSRPITVIADGRTVFEGTVKTSVPTLLKWAAQDNDRTMLFAAELPIRLAN
ncbi:MAG TPA: PDZ domain-containing protein [Vicinamibacterales bacterium]|nr:PDZ domain-containing protein [Vicinamibacterales bacterium]